MYDFTPQDAEELELREGDHVTRDYRNENNWWFGKNQRTGQRGMYPANYVKQVYNTYILIDLGDNCIQNLHLGRYIVGYTVGNLVLRRRVSGAVKRDFRTYIRQYTSPNENFEYGYPHSNSLLTFSLQKDSENVLCCAYTSSGCQPHKTDC